MRACIPNPQTEIKFDLVSAVDELASQVRCSGGVAAGGGSSLRTGWLGGAPATRSR